MLTTEIPEVNSRKSAEDELAQFILDKLKTQNEVCIEYYHAGCAKGNWKDGTWHGDETLHKADSSAIYNVENAFKNKGYIVNDSIRGMNVSVLKISK